MTLDLPHGRYAVTPPLGGERFYLVDAKGLRRLSATGDSPRNRQVVEQPDVVAAIREDRVGAAVRYAEKTGRCWMCGKRLTNEISKARSIGPECITKLDGLDEADLERLGIQIAEAKGLKEPA